MSVGKRIRDIILETIIAVVLVVAFLMYVIKTHDPTKVRNWVPIIQIGNTALVFGLLIQWFRYAWRKAKFWALLCVFLLGHTAVYILLGRSHQLPLFYYAVLDLCELVVFERVIAKLICLNSS
jgi:hypothetical protein